MEKVKAALVGCGRMGAFTSDKVINYAPSCWFPLSHLQALTISNEFIVEAVCDQSDVILDKIKNNYNIKYLYTDFTDLIDSHKIDLLCIATRTVGRASIIKKASDYGVTNFHIEKPLCSSTDELNMIERLIRKNKIQITFGTIRRYMEIYKEAKNLVKSGKFGELTQIDVNLGYGNLYWSHPHSVDIGLFFMNDEMPVKVQACLGKLDLNSSGEKIIVQNDPKIENASMYFHNGVVCRIGKGGNCDVKLICEGGTVKIDADGARILIQEIKNGNSYMDYPPVVINDITNANQGTYAALKYHIKSISEENLSIDSGHILKGQNILFSFILSHIKNSALINPSSQNNNIIINAYSGGNYA